MTQPQELLKKYRLQSKQITAPIHHTQSKPALPHHWAGCKTTQQGRIRESPFVARIS
ncbi:hypothetical protein [Nitrospira sp. M1]